MLARVLCGIVALFAVGACNDAQAAKRVALVVGQGTYANLTELSNPKLDARRMAALLARHGFEVIACEGATPRHAHGSRALWKRQLSARRSVDVRSIYFSLH